MLRVGWRFAGHEEFVSCVVVGEAGAWAGGCGEWFRRGWIWQRLRSCQVLLDTPRADDFNNVVSFESRINLVISRLGSDDK